MHYISGNALWTLGYVCTTLANVSMPRSITRHYSHVLQYVCILTVHDFTGFICKRPLNSHRSCFLLFQPLKINSVQNGVLPNWSQKGFTGAFPLTCWFPVVQHGNQWFQRDHCSRLMLVGLIKVDKLPRWFYFEL